MRDASRRRRAARRRRLVAAGVTIAVLGVGGTAFALRPAEARYRTATVTTGAVAQQVSASATVASATRADATFGTSGTVATVEVVAGDRVEPGDVLATLDADELQDAVDDANEALAAAQKTLADDLEAQSSGATTTSSVSAASGSGAAGASSATGSATLVVGTTSTGEARAVTVAAGGTDPAGQAVEDARAALAAAQADVQAAQEALLAGYASVEDALLASTTALGASGDAVAAATSDQGACAVVLAGGAASRGSSDDGEETGSVVTAEDLAACATAIVTAQEALVATDAAQQTTGTAQGALTDLVVNLDDAVATLGERSTALDAAVRAVLDAQAPGDGSDVPGGGTAGGTGGSGQGSGSGSGGVAPGGATGGATSGERTGGATGTPSGASSPAGGDAGTDGRGTSSGTITAERILAHRAAVTLAERQVDIATAAAAAGTLTAPIAGTVAQVDVTAGDSVGTSDTAVTILGDGGYVLSSTLDLADVKVVAVGQAVTATVPATGQEYTGTVSSVGVLSTSQTSSPSYAATVALDPVDDALPEGASAWATIDVATVDDVLVVPTSAVTADGSTRTVRVLDGTDVRTVTVTTGAVGPELTEIADGLAAGDEVVLADLTQQLVQDDEESSGLTGLGSQGSDRQGSDRQGGFPGGDFPGGGFPQGGGGVGGPPAG